MGKGTFTREDFSADTSGGFLDNVDGPIIAATFEQASGKYADKMLMGGGETKALPVMLTITVDQVGADKPVLKSYSVGGSDVWNIVDGGKSIEHVIDPEKHNFRGGSNAWHLVEGMALAIGGGDIEKGQDFFIERGLPMTDAEFYIGLDFHWEIKNLENNIGGKTVKSKVPVPTKLNASVGKKAAPAGKKTTTAPASDITALNKILIDNASGKDEKQLKSFAVRNAEIKNNTAYMKDIVSGKVLKDLEDAGDLTKDPSTNLYI